VKPLPLCKITTLLGLLLGLAIQTACAAPRYLDIPSLLEGRASADTSPLLEGMRTAPLEVTSSTAGYRVSSAALEAEAGPRRGALVVVTRPDGAFTALVETPEHRGMVIGKADGSQSFHPAREEDLSQDDIVPSPTDRERFAQTVIATPDAPLTVSLLIGMSQAAVEERGDPVAFGLAQVEFVNLALGTSKVDNVRLTLAGVEVTEGNLPMSSASLGKIPTLFKNLVKADLVSGIFAWEAGNIMGIAYRPGRYSITLGSASTLAHEIGHNVDGDHCNLGQDDFRFGQKVGYMNWDSTFMCRDTSGDPLYSTPDVSTSGGVPYGNARTADMARQWRERASVLASYSTGDMPPPAFALRNGSFTNFCVDATPATEGARVAMAACNFNRTSQRWIEWARDARHLVRLEANPQLCLTKDTSTSSAAVLKKCSTLASTHFWTLKENRLVNGLDEKGGILSALYTNGVGHQLQIGTTDSGSRSQWMKDIAPVLLTSLNSDYCLAIPGSPDYGKQIVLARCAGNAASQQWVLEDSGHIRSVANSNLCLDVGGFETPAAIKLGNCAALENNYWSGPRNLIVSTARQDCIGTSNPAKDKEPVVMVSCLNNRHNAWNPIRPF